MDEFDFEESIMINAEVAYEMRTFFNREGKILYAYTVLNTYANSYKQKLYAEALKKHLREDEYVKVIAETSFGKFDNLTFWVDKTIKDIEEYSIYINGYEQKSFMEDAVKGAFCFFIDTAWCMNKKAAEMVLDRIKESDVLQFLQPVAFYKKQQLQNCEYTGEKTEEERYMDLLDFEFVPGDFFYDLKMSDEENVRKCAINQKKRKQENQETIATQLSLFGLFKG